MLLKLAIYDEIKKKTLSWSFAVGKMMNLMIWNSSTGHMINKYIFLLSYYHMTGNVKVHGL